jgi:hypothetical protein
VRLVEVLWNDAFELSSNDWYSVREIEDVVPVDKTGEPTLTVGYVIRENDRHIILAQTWNCEEQDKASESLSGIMFIPKGMIVDVRDK